MKVTVCELPEGWAQSEARWTETVSAIQRQQSDLVLLPEMPFYRWLAGSPQADPARWQSAVAAHDQLMTRLHELSTPIVIGSRPVGDHNRRHNQGFVWEATSGYRPAHTKYYLPDEAGFWEASWYQRGDGRFENGVEYPSADVALATGISAADCERLALGYYDPASLDPADWEGREEEGVLLVPKAGEMLYRVRPK